jgi:hypothetical protein
MCNLVEIKFYFIFLNPRTDLDLLNEIYFIFFWVQMNPAQNFELCKALNIFQKLKKKIVATQVESTTRPSWIGPVRPACRARAAHGLVGRPHGSPTAPSPRHDAFAWGTLCGGAGSTAPTMGSGWLTTIDGGDALAQWRTSAKKQRRSSPARHRAVETGAAHGVDGDLGQQSRQRLALRGKVMLGSVIPGFYAQFKYSSYAWPRINCSTYTAKNAHR